MQGLTRGAVTLIGVAVAGFLIWFGASALPGDGDATQGEFWWAVALIAAAGLVMALSQLLGGWTKWGWPHISRNVFLLGFLPALIAGGWAVAAAEPGDHWLGSHVREWSEDIGLESLVGDLVKAWPALAFGVGLVLGFTLDTKGPRREPEEAAAGVPEPEAPARDVEPDDRPVPVREGETPQPEAPPRDVEPDDRPVPVREGETPQPEAPPRSGVPPRDE
jgi:hypothetical protein